MELKTSSLVIGFASRGSGVRIPSAPPPSRWAKRADGDVEVFGTQKPPILPQRAARTINATNPRMTTKLKENPVLRPGFARRLRRLLERTT
jgi:hypothetical protein